MDIERAQAAIASARDGLANYARRMEEAPAYRSDEGVGAQPWKLINPIAVLQEFIHAAEAITPDEPLKHLENVAVPTVVYDPEKGPAFLAHHQAVQDLLSALVEGMAARVEQ